MDRDVLVVTGLRRYWAAKARLVDELVAAGYKHEGAAQNLGDVRLAALGHELTVVTMDDADCDRALCRVLQEAGGMVVWVGNGRGRGHRPPEVYGLALVVIRRARYVPKFMRELPDLRSPDPTATWHWCQRVFGPRLKLPTGNPYAYSVDP